MAALATEVAPPDGHPEVEGTQMQGWLQKQGWVNTAWQQRFFVLNTLNGTLDYHTDDPKKGGQLRGSIQLKECTMYPVDDEPENPNQFIVQTVMPAEGGEASTIGRAYILKADHALSREAWMELCRLHGSSAVCTGWLTKQGHFMPTWRRRWFVLDGDMKLNYFTGPSGTWKGTVDLRGADLAIVKGHETQFKILPRQGGENEYLIEAASVAERDAWLRHCERVQLSPGEDLPENLRLGGDTDLASHEAEFAEHAKLNDFQILKVVGKGGFGRVMMAKKKSGEGEGKIFAIKVLDKKHIRETKQTRNVMSERGIMVDADFPFLVNLRYSFQSGHKLYLVTDYYNGGNLYTHLRKAEGFDEVRTRFYAAELFLALDHLHAIGVVYRDLKLENILMDHQGHIALTDFGLSKQGLAKVFDNQLTTLCGTPEYLAPEVLRGEQYSASVDMWSYGVLVYEMRFSRTPFHNRKRKIMYHGIISTEPQFPATFSPELRDFTARLLNKNPRHRLGCGAGNRGQANGPDEVKNHPFFASAEVDWDALSRKEVEPPWTPKLSGPDDLAYVPANMQRLDPEPEVAYSVAGSHQKWSGFTYAETQLGEDAAASPAVRELAAAEEEDDLDKTLHTKV